MLPAEVTICDKDVPQFHHVANPLYNGVSFLHSKGQGLLVDPLRSLRLSKF